jgi:hypothetical protein
MLGGSIHEAGSTEDAEAILRTIELFGEGGLTTATAGKRKQPNKPCINSGVTRTDIATHRTPRSTVTLLITSEDRFDIPLSGNYCQHPTITSLLDRPSGGNRQQQHNNFSSNRKLNLYTYNQEYNNINKKGNIDHKVGDQRKDPFFRDVEQDSAARGGARTLHLTGYTPRSCQQPDPSRDETGCQDLPLVPTGSDSVKTTYQWVWGYQYLVFEQKPRIERECAYSPACTYGD